MLFDRLPSLLPYPYIISFLSEMSLMHIAHEAIDIWDATKMVADLTSQFGLRTYLVYIVP